MYAYNVRCSTDVQQGTSNKRSLIPPKMLVTKWPTAWGLEGSDTPPRAARRASGLKGWGGGERRREEGRRGEKGRGGGEKRGGGERRRGRGGGERRGGEGGRGGEGRRGEEGRGGEGERRW